MTVSTTATSPAAEVAAALEKLVKLHNVAEQLPGRIAEAEAEYAEAVERLGFPLPGTKRRGGTGTRRAVPAAAAPPGGTGRRGGRKLGEASLAILDIIDRAGAAGATAGDIAEALDTTSSKVSASLVTMESAASPRVRCDRTADPARWFLTGPVPELGGGSPPPAGVEAAALDAAGVEVA